MTKLDRFMAVYEVQLEKAVKKYPGEYPWYWQLHDGLEREQPVRLKTVVGRMRAAFSRDSFDKEGYAIKWTCKALGIPYTYKGIRDFIREDSETTCG